ncbi:MAG: nitroreductase [Clostridiaceae bacterium]|nr:nitroreductase [Clostridiaceae bacterium]
MDIKQAITQRRSVRTYKDEPISQELREKLKSYIADVPSPFNPRTRFVMLDTDEISGRIKLGTYGVINGAKTFICGISEKAFRYEENLGYAFERIILYATSLGLGTCWLGGTFNRANFAKAAELKGNEVIPVVSPVGYPKEKRNLIDSVLVKSAGSVNRKDWSELFFDGNFENPLKRETDHKIAEALDMVRLAPSASNKQPWRIVKSGQLYHFFLSRTPGYKTLLGFDIQRLDIGIAMCHFEMMIQELGLKGKWIDEDPGINPEKNTEYIISYLVE